MLRGGIENNSFIYAVFCRSFRFVSTYKRKYTQIKHIRGLNFNYAAIIRFPGKICVHLCLSTVQ